MARAHCCAVCGHAYQPEPRSWRHQRYCSKRCARKAKRERDRIHKQRYRETGLGREQRRRENERYRDQVGWTEYMRYWRKADSGRRAGQERKRAERYYERHREPILQKRRETRVAQKAAKKARSH